MGSALRSGSARGSASRLLRIEPLEDRRVLDVGLAAVTVSPWQNPANPLDTNHDGAVSAIDALDVIDQLLTDGSGPLPSTVAGTPSVYCDTNGDGVLSPFDALLIINALSTAPQVTLTTVTPMTPDLTPQVTVTASAATPIPNGTLVSIDVDLNNDGNFTSNYMQAPLFNGAATFDLAPALPAEQNGQAYQVNLRAHLSLSAGSTGYSTAQSLVVDTNVATALKDYVDTPDPTYSYSLAQTTVDPNGQYTIYDLLMISQTWRSTADVNQPVWQSWVRIIVPTGTISKTALFLIDGGGTSNTPPTVDSTALGYAATAVQLHSVMVDLKDVPNEPLIFTGDPGDPRTEDAIIAYTYNEFMDNIGADGNDTWPALLPMVKSAVRGMDTVQSWVASVDPGQQINGFVLTGYSKRGWTTWLTSTVDSRVEAIIPGVFDALDLGEQMVHQDEVYGFFSPAVQDYNNLNIFSRMMTPQGESLAEIVDPYRYLSEPKYQTMPKLMIDSAGDEFFVSDSAQYYIHDIPGSQNYIRYIPNVGHGLDATDTAESTLTFTYAVLNNSPLPKFSWQVMPDGSIDVQTTTTPSQVLLWQATNPTARDFRHAYNPSIVWTSSTLSDQGNGLYVGSTPMPASGATAFFVQLSFPSPIPGDPYIFTTEIHVNSTLPLYVWPYAANVAGVVGTTADSLVNVASFNQVAFAVSAQAAASTASVSSGTPSTSLGSSTSSSTAVSTASSPASMLLDDTNATGTTAPTPGGVNPLLIDAVFGSSLDDELG